MLSAEKQLQLMIATHTKISSLFRFDTKPFHSISSFVILVIGLTVLSCNSQTSKQSETDSKEDTTQFSRENIEIKYAHGFTITNFNHYRIATIYSSTDTKRDSTTYLLLERGQPKPEGYDHAQLIETPIRSLVAMSSMHIGMLDFLESNAVLVGLSNTQYVYTPSVIAMIDSGKIAEIGRNQGINQEKLIVLNPDLLMTMGSSNAANKQYPSVAQAGIPMLANSEWLETTPLARAEWVKLLAVLLHKESLANEKFEILENQYNHLLQITKKLSNRPVVLSGINTKDTWYVPTGENYMAHFLMDAGGTYPWAHTQGQGSIPLNFEAVYPKALTADIWLNVGFDPNDTQSSLLGTDQRYADFKAFKTGKVYSYNNRVNDRGSNDFFESGLMAPEVVLADIIKILHPQLLPNHGLVYYKQLP